MIIQLGVILVDHTSKNYVRVYKFNLQLHSIDFDKFLYFTILGHEKTIGLDYMFEKILLMDYFGLLLWVLLILLRKWLQRF